MNEENQAPIIISSPPPEKIKQKSAWKSLFKEILIFALIAFGVVLPFRMFIAEPYLVDGPSMDPTFKTGDYLIVVKLSYEVGAPQRNTVIVFKYPGDPKNNPNRTFLQKLFDPGRNFIKRVIGLPGETVVIKNNTVTIINKENPKGFQIDQSYVTHFTQDEEMTKTLGSDEYFVMGDNRAESYDSRAWGPVPKSYVIGEPILRLWPVMNLGIMPGRDNK